MADKKPENFRVGIMPGIYSLDLRRGYQPSQDVNKDSASSKLEKTLPLTPSAGIRPQSAFGGLHPFNPGHMPYNIPQRR